MNMFILDDNIERAAQMHHDVHCRKMILETAQILCTASHDIFVNYTPPYKNTHRHHPLVKWAGETLANYRYCVLFGIHLGNEYTYRFNKTHKSSLVIDEINEECWVYENINPLKKKTQLNLTKMPLCVDEEFQHLPDVQAHRRNYNKNKLHDKKGRRAVWTKRGIPYWVDMNRLFTEKT